MIARTRTILQARIDENYEVIKRLISSVPDMIRASFAKAEDDAKEIALHSCDFDRVVYFDIYKSLHDQVRPEEEEWMILETYRSYVLLICSYAETTMKSMMKRPFEKRKSGLRFIEDSFNQIKGKYQLVEVPEIVELWPNFGVFFDKRNDIAHGYKDEKDYENLKEVIVEKKELAEALEGAYKLLRSCADAIDIKERGEVLKEGNYLWTPESE